MFFILYLFRSKALIKNLKYVGVAVGIAAIFPITLRVLYSFDMGGLFSQLVGQWSVTMVGREFSIWQYFLLNTMPSGYVTRAGGYLMLEFWYLFAIFAFAYLVRSHLRKVSSELLAIALFIAMFFIVGCIGSYYMIVVQPFLCIPVGYAILKLVKGSTLTTLFFCLFIYAPAVLSVDLYLASGALFEVESNLALFALKFVTIGVPILLLFGQLLRSDVFSKNIGGFSMLCF